MSFKFPKLSWQEITTCLNELGIPASRDELRKPDENKESLRKVLEYLAEISTGSSREEWAQPAFAGLNAINYPELHEESIPNLNALRAIIKMMENSQIQDFTIKDLIAPTTERLNRQLSGIVNFAKFREDRLLLLQELQQTRTNLLDELKTTREQHEALHTRLSMLRHQTQEETEQMLNLEQEIKELQHKNNELKRSLELLDNQSQFTQEQYMKLSDKVEETKHHYHTLQDQELQLSRQVVSSPGKFRKQIVETSQLLQHEQKDGKLAERKVKELTLWLQSIEEAQQDVDIVYQQVQSIRQEVEKQKQMIIDVAQVQQQVNQLQLNYSESSQTQQKTRIRLSLS
jgi:kinetochore protein Nuf2